ncbi:sugar phosphate isomerase/epimerase family protein [Sunxiuqinia dokdonensis]|uniref:Xylose isomerase-like TIM barrel domain-containing protein n=1 Tax=Sunxiuqinia dokdonensis TaxID=1409788 RepID=A0A0L8V2T5_9BACT|nr:sugar phosphate isomerase/epimerase family protein [Sunxiuqinia dokdonensis]KOH42542.1 hypothetical protein NC99_46300 [Sunxiuqinia dokdonensis]
MGNSVSRRDLLKAALAAPIVAAGSMAPGYAGALIPEIYSHLLKLSLNLYSFNSLLSRGERDLFDMLDFCASHNFEAIDPTGYYFPGYPEVPSDGFIFEFKRQAFLLGLDISGTGVRNDFASPNASDRRKDVELIKKWVEVAAKLGSPNLRIFAGASSHEGFSRDEVFEWMAKDIRECCDYAAQFGVMIALQNHNDFLKTADDVDRIFNLVDSDWLGLNLDIGSYRQKDPYVEIQQNIARAVTWQIKENVWIDGVEAPTDYVKLFKIIKESGYRGYLPLETLGPGDPYGKVPNLLRQIRSALEQV